MTDSTARSFLPARNPCISLTPMLRVLIIFAFFFGVLANAVHVEAHASGQHRHDAVEASHHADGHDDDREAVDRDADESRTAKADQKVDHAAGHSHVVGDRSSTLAVSSRAYSDSDARYRVRPELVLLSALSAPLLEPPSA